MAKYKKYYSENYVNIVEFVIYNYKYYTSHT